MHIPSEKHLLGKSLTEQVDIVWPAFEEQLRESLFLDPDRPSEEERNNLLMVCVGIFSRLLQVVLTSTSGNVRAAICNSLLTVMKRGIEAREIYEAQGGLEQLSVGEEFLNAEGER